MKQTIKLTESQFKKVITETIKKVLKEDNELNIGDNTNTNLLNFIKQRRLQAIQEWQKEIEKYEEHLNIETNEYAINLKKDEIERLRKLISVYSQ